MCIRVNLGSRPTRPRFPTVGMSTCGLLGNAILSLSPSGRRHGATVLSLPPSRQCGFHVSGMKCLPDDGLGGGVIPDSDRSPTPDREPKLKPTRNPSPEPQMGFAPICLQLRRM